MQDGDLGDLAPENLTTWNVSFPKTEGDKYMKVIRHSDEQIIAILKGEAEPVTAALCRQSGIT